MKAMLTIMVSISLSNMAAKIQIKKKKKKSFFQKFESNIRDFLSKILRLQNTHVFITFFVLKRKLPVSYTTLLTRGKWYFNPQNHHSVYINIGYQSSFFNY